MHEYQARLRQVEEQLQSIELDPGLLLRTADSHGAAEQPTMPQPERLRAGARAADDAERERAAAVAELRRSIEQQQLQSGEMADAAAAVQQARLAQAAQAQELSEMRQQLQEAKAAREAAESRTVRVDEQLAQAARAENQHASTVMELHLAREEQSQCAKELVQVTKALQQAKREQADRVAEIEEGWRGRQQAEAARVAAEAELKAELAQSWRLRKESEAAVQAWASRFEAQSEAHAALRAEHTALHAELRAERAERLRAGARAADDAERERAAAVAELRRSIEQQQLQSGEMADAAAAVQQARLAQAAQAQELSEMRQQLQEAKAAREAAESRTVRQLVPATDVQVDDNAGDTTLRRCWRTGREVRSSKGKTCDVSHWTTKLQDLEEADRHQQKLLAELAGIMMTRDQPCKLHTWTAEGSPQADRGSREERRHLRSPLSPVTDAPSPPAIDSGQSPDLFLQRLDDDSVGLTAAATGSDVELYQQAEEHKAEVAAWKTKVQSLEAALARPVDPQRQRPVSLGRRFDYATSGWMAAERLTAERHAASRLAAEAAAAATLCGGVANDGFSHRFELERPGVSIACHDSAKTVSRTGQSDLSSSMSPAATTVGRANTERWW